MHAGDIPTNVADLPAAEVFLLNQVQNKIVSDLCIIPYIRCFDFLS